MLTPLICWFKIGIYVIDAQACVLSLWNIQISKPQCRHLPLPCTTAHSHRHWSCRGERGKSTIPRFTSTIDSSVTNLLTTLIAADFDSTISTPLEKHSNASECYIENTDLINYFSLDGKQKIRWTTRCSSSTIKLIRQIILFRNCCCCCRRRCSFLRSFRISLKWDEKKREMKSDENIECVGKRTNLLSCSQNRILMINYRPFTDWTNEISSQN